MVSTIGQAAEVPLYWKVLNNNRLFLDEDNQQKFEQELCRARECSKKYEGSDHICQPYFKKLGSKAKLYCPDDRQRTYQGASYWIPFPEKIRTAWSERSHSYERKADYVFSRQRDIRARAPSIPEGTTCRWELSPAAVRDEAATECAEYRATIEIDTPYKLSLHLTKPDNSTQDVSRDVLVHDVFIVALGDSYSSGEGNPHTLRGLLDRSPYQPTQLEQWWDRRCHRSLLNFTSIAVGLAAIQNTLLDTPKHSFTYMNFACSGAEIKGTGGLLTPYAGRETADQIQALESLFSFPRDMRRMIFADKLLHSQVEQLEAMLCPGGAFVRDCPNMKVPDYVIMTVGGNDIGFGDIIRDAITTCGGVGQALGFVKACAIDSVKQRFEQLKKDFDELAKTLRDIKPKKVLLSEYVDLTHSERRESCDDFSMDRTLGPAGIIGVGVKRDTAEVTYQTVLLELNKVLKGVAEAHSGEGWKFVSGIEHRSEIRGWCAKPSWFVRWADSSYKQGFLPGDDGALSRTLTTGIAHPNVFGQNFAAWRIRCEFDKDGLIPAGFSQLPVDPKAACEPKP
jgi:hypothetical protein